MRGDPPAGAYASWADRIYNPWLSPTRCLGSAFGLVASLRTSLATGAYDETLRWEADAQTFALVHGRRQRIFAGPWCWALDPNAPGHDREAFAMLVERTPSLDWFVLGTSKHIAHRETDEFLSKRSPMWVGIKIDDSRTCASALNALRKTKASNRFAVINTVTADFGDLDLSELDWLIISIDADQESPEPDWIASIKLQAMGYGVPVWFDTPSANILGEAVPTPFTVREQPRRKPARR